MFYFYLVSFLVFTGMGHSSAQAVSLYVCVFYFHLFFVRSCFVIKEGKGMMFFVVVLLTSDVCNKRREGYDALFSSFF